MIFIYTKPGCIFCDKAKNLLQMRGIEYKELRLDEDFTRSELKEIFPLMKTYPVILDGNELIGGYQELIERVSNVGFGKVLLNE